MTQDRRNDRHRRGRLEQTCRERMAQPVRATPIARILPDPRRLHIALDASREAPSIGKWLVWRPVAEKHPGRARVGTRRGHVVDEGIAHHGEQREDQWTSRLVLDEGHRAFCQGQLNLSCP